MKTKILLLLLILTGVFSKAHSQLTLEWDRTFQGISNRTTTAAEVVTDKVTGDVYVAGYSLDSLTTTQRVILSKYNSSGNLIWKTRDTTGTIVKLLLNQNGPVMLLNVSTYTKYICIYTTDGFVSNRFPTDSIIANTMALDNNGNIILGGTLFTCLAIKKLSPFGAPIWAKRIIPKAPYNNTNHIDDITIDNSNNILTVGYTNLGNYPFPNSVARECDIVCKFNGATGDSLWALAIQRSVDGNYHTIKTDPANNVYVFRNFYQYSNYPIYGGGVELVKISSQGNTVTHDSSLTSGGGVSINGKSLAVDAFGNAFATNYSSSTNYKMGLFMYPSNNSAPTKILLGASGYNYFGRQVVIDKKGDAVFLGSYWRTSDTSQAIKILKYNSLFALTDSISYITGKKGGAANSIDVGPNNQLYSCSYIYNASSGYNALVYKYSIPNKPPSALVFNRLQNKLSWNKPSTGANSFIVWKRDAVNNGNWKSLSDSGGVISSTDSIYNIQPSGFYDYKVGAVYLNGDTVFSNVISVDVSYYLRYKDSTSSVQTYDPSKYGFKLIPNADAWLWSPIIYNTFNYQNAAIFPQELFGDVKSNYHVDWVTAADVRTPQYAYNGASFNPAFVGQWKRDSREGFKGACFGFTISSLMIYNKFDKYYSKFPFMTGAVPGTLEQTKDISQSINYLFCTQIYSPSLKIQDITGGPKFIVKKLMEVFSDPDVKKYYGLGLRANNKAHSVLPYAIQKGSGSTLNILVYDSNDPTNYDTKILVDTSSNVWHYLPLFPADTTAGLILQTNYTSIFDPPPPTTDKLALMLDSVDVSIGGEASCFFINGTDTIAGYNRVSGNIINEAKTKVIFSDGNLYAPPQYRIPFGNYSVEFKNYKDSVSNSSLFVQTDTNSYSGYERTGLIDTSDVDIIKIANNKLTYINPGILPKTIKLTQVIESNSGTSMVTNSSGYFEANSINIAGGSDSVSIKRGNGNNINITNYGSAGQMNIVMYYAAVSGPQNFTAFNIPLAANSTLIAQPDWSNLTSSPLTIQIDNGNNGTIDDSLIILNSPLPVELSSFTSQINNRNITLKWSTAAEHNNSGFDIERKVDNQSWKKIGNVLGIRNSNSSHSYSFLDMNIETGKYNYRLKQIDVNGNFKYFNLQNEVVVGVPNKFEMSQNYPNPFNPATKINYDLPFDSKVQIKIFDMTGREVYELVNQIQTAGFYTTQFNTSALASGVYFYQIIANGGKQTFVKTMKMVLVK